MKNFKWILILSFSIILAGCGFHLRGKEAYSTKVKTLYFSSKYPYNEFARVLKANLENGGAKLANSQTAAPYTLRILSEQKQQPMATVGSSQQVRQYTLYYIVTFQLEDSKGNVIFGPQSVTEQRSQIVQPSQVLSDSNETDFLYKAMYRDASEDIIAILDSDSALKAIDTYKADLIKAKQEKIKKAKENAKAKAEALKKAELRKKEQAAEKAKQVNPNKLGADNLPDQQDDAPVAAEKAPTKSELADRK